MIVKALVLRNIVTHSCRLLLRCRPSLLSRLRLLRWPPFEMLILYLKLRNPGLESLNDAKKGEIAGVGPYLRSC